MSEKLRVVAVWECRLCGREVSSAPQEEARTRAQEEHVEHHCRVARILRKLPPETPGEQIIKLLDVEI